MQLASSTVLASYKFLIEVGWKNGYNTRSICTRGPQGFSQVTDIAEEYQVGHVEACLNVLGAWFMLQLDLPADIETGLCGLKAACLTIV